MFVQSLERLQILCYIILNLNERRESLALFKTCRVSCNLHATKTMNNEIKNAIAARFDINADLVAAAFDETESVAAACRMLEISPRPVRKLMRSVVKRAATVETAVTETALVPAPAPIVADESETETLAVANEIDATEPETETVIPEMTMLEKMRQFETNAPRVEISKLFKMKCKSEIVFFDKRRQMFTPTDAESARMRELIPVILANLPATNKLDEPVDYVNATAVTEQQTDRANAPKSAFFLNDVSYQIAVRFA